MNKIFFMILLLLSFPAVALPLEDPLPDTVQEATARNIFHALHCVVCQGQSIADSNADIAADMRREVRTRVAAGESRESILAFFAAHYGDSVRMSPPVSLRTAVLWLAPLLIVAVGFAIARRCFRRRA